MANFIQLHTLTSYPPVNLNRDDIGRPKTAWMGGVERLRVSSQSLKRAWRKSELFESALQGHVGERTKLLGRDVFEKLKEQGMEEALAKNCAQKIAEQFGKRKAEEKKKKPSKKEGKEKEEMGPSYRDLEIEQLVHIGPLERQAINELVDRLAQEKREPVKEELELLRKPIHAVDIALFGRMLADSPAYNVEAAAQVAHAISVHSVLIEDDYFTAVDDLSDPDKTRGSAHLGEDKFSSAIFYNYICINEDLLRENLDANDDLVKKTLAALTEAVLKVPPTGKQNSYASRAYAYYAMAEKGSQQPRSLSISFVDPVGNKDESDYIQSAIMRLKKQYGNFNKTYGKCSDSIHELNAVSGEGDCHAFLQFVSGV